MRLIKKHENFSNMKFIVKAAVLATLNDSKVTRGANKVYTSFHLDTIFHITDDLDVISSYRLSKSTIMTIVRDIEPLVPIGNSTKYTVLTKVLITLFHLAHGNSFTSMVSTFHIPASTIRYIVWQIIELIVLVYQNTDIQYKGFDEHWFEQQANDFSTRYPNCPSNVFGAIDCTYIYVKIPDDDHWFEYIDKDKDICIKAQILCNYNYEIVDVLVGYPGSVHDISIFQVSNVFDYFENTSNFITNQYRFIGDSAYPTRCYLGLTINCGGTGLMKF